MTRDIYDIYDIYDIKACYQLITCELLEFKNVQSAISIVSIYPMLLKLGYTK